MSTTGVPRFTAEHDVPRHLWVIRLTCERCGLLVATRQLDMWRDAPDTPAVTAEVREAWHQHRCRRAFDDA